MDPVRLLKPRRTITGMCAILLPFLDDGAVDWGSFEAHVRRTADAGLRPAVNMDTGYVSLIDGPTRRDVLRRTRDMLGGRPFVAGAFVSDPPGARWNPDAYRERVEEIHAFGGIPVIFPSYGLTALEPAALVDAYHRIGEFAPRFIAFELGTMFAPFGKIYDVDVYRGLMSAPQCIGAKHSSLSREMEWQRLRLRDQTRPDFLVLTGNDLAIDMVMYGSDYLLGLSTFAPDLFARRDALWANGDPAFYALNDLLQYLGFLAFRAPVPAYRHSAAQFLHLRGWIATSRTHPGSPERPASDMALLRDIAARLGILPGDER
ncbi:MAG: dihydrodipicolinate synthase family protein [Anaerolineae bacterium]|nr:dihydrodipicolinate synthase family protein [Anaerolineae bacterium]